MAKFTAKGGIILHSTEHKRAANHKGKKVVVIGACTSAHDIAADYCLNGVGTLRTSFRFSSNEP